MTCHFPQSLFSQGLAQLPRGLKKRGVGHLAGPGQRCCMTGDHELHVTGTADGPGKKCPHLLFFKPCVTVFLYATPLGCNVCDAHLVFSQQFALPERVGNVMDGQAEVVSASLKMQSFGFLQKLPTHLPLELEDLLQDGNNKKKSGQVVSRQHKDVNSHLLIPQV